MISKGRTGSSFGGLHGYLLRGRPGAGFGPGLQDYLLDGRSGEEQERVAWTSARNLPTADPRYAAVVMDATASQNPRVLKPVYHLMLSPAPGESFTQAEWESVADRMLKHLKLEEHQALLVAHRDTGHEHLHVMINRVHIDTLKAWDNGYDYARRERALRQIERELGLREVPGPHYRLPGQERPEHDRGLTSGERQEKERTRTEPWAEKVRARIRDDVKSAASWVELEAKLKQHGLHLRKRGRGLVITDGERMVKSSRVDRGSSYAKLAERFGSTFEEWRRDREALLRAAGRAERVERVRSEVEDRAARYRRERAAAAEVLHEHRNVNRSARGEVKYLAAELERAFRPSELRAVWRRLGALVRREGLERAAHVVHHEPHRLGRLRGIGFARLGNDARVDADLAVRRAAESLQRLHYLRQGRRRLRPLVRRASAEQHRAGVRLDRAAKILRRLPRRQLDRQLAQLGLKIGLKAVELVLPSKLVLPVKAAVRALELARSVGRGYGRGD